jgi:RimJ/RimL family protein N-acetyltransferase
MVPTVRVMEMKEKDLPFLLDLWRQVEVMQYADEFPRLRGWSRSDCPERAWELHEGMRSTLGEGYSQLILRDAEGTLIGESFSAPLKEGATFGKWHKPQGTLTLMGDIKLAKPFWGRGLGTEGMKQVVLFRFSKTACDLFCVPPHRKNPAAFSVYQKAGFELYRGMRSYRNHRIMEISRARYKELYDPMGC